MSDEKPPPACANCGYLVTWEMFHAFKGSLAQWCVRCKRDFITGEEMSDVDEQRRNVEIQKIGSRLKRLKVCPKCQKVLAGPFHKC